MLSGLGNHHGFVLVRGLRRFRSHDVRARKVLMTRCHSVHHSSVNRQPAARTGGTPPPSCRKSSTKTGRIASVGLPRPEQRPCSEVGQQGRKMQETLEASSVAPLPTCAPSEGGSTIDVEPNAVVRHRRITAAARRPLAAMPRADDKPSFVVDSSSRTFGLASVICVSLVGDR